MRISDWSSGVCSSDLKTDGALASGGAIDRLIRAVETFGFHLATLDLRQNSNIHERVVAELLKTGGVEADYLALDENARIALLRKELATNRPLSGRFAEYSEETTSELDIINADADAHRAYGPQCITVYNISKRSEEHTSELQSLMRISYAVFCLKNNISTKNITTKLM